MFNGKKIYQIAIVLIVLLLIAGVAKFYHYNYVANTMGQARSLRLPGLKEFICKGEPYKPGDIDQCGKRGIYGDADWGITAYITVYGVESREEAEAIARFIVETRKQSGQEHIPVNLQVYSVPRSAGSSRPSKYKILDQNL